MNCANDCINYLTAPSLIPIAFTYNGAEHRGLKDGFGALTVKKRSFCDRAEYELSAQHLSSGAVFKVYLTHWEDRGGFSIRAQIEATRRTEIFSDIHWRYTVRSRDAYLYGNLGDDVSGQTVGYGSYCYRLREGGVHQKNRSGRPTHGYFPYYRISTEDESGIFIALSWQGRWYADFTQEEQEVIFRGGQAGFESYLEKGEIIRVPLMLVLEYWQDHVNTWRRFFIHHIMPRPGGRLPSPMVSVSNGTCAGLSEGLLRDIKSWYEKNGIDYDFWWCDAGWCADGASSSNPEGLWLKGANYEINRDAFPDGLAWLGRELARQKRQLLMWFEPEVVRTPDDMMEQFFKHNEGFKAEWILGRGGKQWNGLDLCWRLINMGEPEAVEWIENRIFSVMDEAGATIFRIDFNIPPAEFWDKNDSEGRRGITENKYCQGYLRLIEDISRRYGCIMDSCSEGGGRNDLETMQYMLPLHYTDRLCNDPEDADGFISMQMNLWQWFPYIRNTVRSDDLKDDYLVRSKYAQCLGIGNPIEKLAEASAEGIKAAVALWRRVAEYSYGDMYLLAVGNDDSVRAYELYCLDKKQGVAVVFTHGGRVELELKGVAVPEVTDADGKSFEVHGNRLCFDALDREARIFFIREK